MFSSNSTAHRTGVAAAVTVVGLSVGLVGTSSAEEQIDYVNLGDSFSAGSGVLPIAPGSYLACWQSGENFSRDIADAKGYGLTDVSCGAATTRDFTTSQYPGLAPQLEALSAETDLVTMTIGGNDNFTLVDAIVSCGTAAFTTGGKGSPCKDIHGDRFAEAIKNDTYPKLVAALNAVKDKAPNAKVVIAGYPWIIPESGGCFPQVPIAEGDIPYMRDLQATLNNAVRRAATATEITYADMSEASDGHDACKSPGVRWVEPAFGSRQLVPVHPNVLGEQKMAEQIMDTVDLP